MNSQAKKEQIVNVKANEIIKLFSSPENKCSFAIENSKIQLYNYRFIHTKINRL